ncbi:putative protein E6 [Helianthus anomalus]
MATIAYILLFFLTLSSTTFHARESQFFAKVSNNNNPKETQPLNTNQNFIPQAQEVVPYGHESGQLPPSATNNNNDNNNNVPKYLPENYNPVAYTTPIRSTTQDIPEEYRQEPAAYQYNGESSMYNSVTQGMSNTRILLGTNGEKQGTSDNPGEEMYNSQKQAMGGETTYGTNNDTNMRQKRREDGRSQPNHGTEAGTSGKNRFCISIGNLSINTNMISNEGYTTVGYYKKNENAYNNSDEGWMITFKNVTLVLVGAIVGVIAMKVQAMCSS